MTLLSRLRAAALSALLVAAPVRPALAQSPDAAPAPGLSQQASEALFEQALQRPAPRAGFPAFDASQLSGLFGDKAELTFTNAGYDRTTGAHKLTNVSLRTTGSRAKTLLAADEALLWNFDATALSARLKGERLGETITLFDRVELKGAAFDLSEFSNAFNAALQAAFDQPQAAIQQSEMKAGTLALGKLTLHPWTYKIDVAEERGKSALMGLSALARSFSLDSMLFLDAVNTQTSTEDDLTGTVVARYPRQLVYGYDRGRIDGMVQSGVDFEGRFTGDIEQDGETTSTNFDMSGRSGYGAWSGADFSKLLEWGEKGEMPPAHQRDVMKLGQYVVEDMSIALSGKPVIEIGALEFSADRFAWLMPEQMTIRHSDVAIDLGNFLAFVEAATPEGLETSGEMSVQEIATMLQRSGLNRISGNGEINLNWDPATGAGTFENRGVMNGLFGGIFRMEGALPTYNEIAASFGADGQSFDETVFDTLMSEKADLTKLTTQLTDLGGLDALAKLTIEIAKVSSSSDPTLASFAESTPQNVRATASGLVMLSGFSASQEVPDAMRWATQLSQFLSRGGTFELSLTPKKDMAALSEGGMAELSLSQLAEQFGVAVKHTPPPASGQTP